MAPLGQRVGISLVAQPYRSEDCDDVDEEYDDDGVDDDDGDHDDDHDGDGDGDDVDDHDDEMLQAEASRLRGEAAALQAALSNHRETCR